MALKNLTDDEMLDLSSAWIDPKRRRSTLEAEPLLAALLPSIEAAHAGLLAGDGSGCDDAQERERATLYEQGVALDRRHDRKGRGVFTLLSALVDLSDDPAEAEALLALRRALFADDNLAVLGASWKGEAANARRVRESVLGNASVAARLDGIQLIGGQTLLDGVKDFVSAGEKLGAVEDQRASVGGAATAERASARNRWIAVSNSLVHLVDDLLELEPTARRALLGATSDAEGKADARTLARRPAEAVTESVHVGRRAPR